MRIKDKCSTCKGEGEIPIEHPHNGDILDWEPCNRCKKTGYIYRELTLEERIERVEARLGIE
jgi:DnaJ-class molecular chaperone